MKRVSIDSWPNRAFSIESYPAVATIETIFPQLKYLLYYGELFSVLS